jgi:hypothetical protein
MVNGLNMCIRLFGLQFCKDYAMKSIGMGNGGVTPIDTTGSGGEIQ